MAPGWLELGTAELAVELELPAAAVAIWGATAREFNSPESASSSAGKNPCGQVSAGVFRSNSDEKTCLGVDAQHEQCCVLVQRWVGGQQPL